MKNEINTTEVKEITVLEDFEGSSLSYASFIPETVAEKALLFNAVNSPDEKVSALIGKTIRIRDVVIEKANVVNEKTGVVEVAPRVVLIDTDGKSYGCVSFGMYQSVCKLVKFFGNPTWKEGVLVEVQNKDTRNGKKTMNLKAMG